MNSEKTAISRKKASRPLRAALELGAVIAAVKGKVLDYGCGKGKDVEELQRLGFKVTGYDPHFQPKKPRGRFHLVLMTYVVNVLEAEARIDALREAWKYVKKGGRLIITSRTEKEICNEAVKHSWKRYQEGFITNRGTYQRGFSIRQLERLVINILDKVRNVQTGPSNAGGAMVIVLKE